MSLDKKHGIVKGIISTTSSEYKVMAHRPGKQYIITSGSETSSMNDSRSKSSNVNGSRSLLDESNSTDNLGVGETLFHFLLLQQRH